MKISIRRGVFETNSSSSHSLSICGGSDCENKYLCHYEDNVVITSPGEYGWNGPTLCSPDERLSYIITMVFEQYRNEHYLTKKEGQRWLVYDAYKLMDTPEFKEIEKCIVENTEYTGLKLDQDFYDTDDAYIDHQSFSDDYESYKDFLDYYNLTLADFLFNDKYQVIITNDNC